MKRNITIFISMLLLGMNNVSNAQDYKNGIGFRGGWIGGITYKHFIQEGKALEGIFSTGWGWKDGYQITLLYEAHKAAFTTEDIPGFFWFYGGGAHFSGSNKNREWHATGTWTGYWVYRKYSTIGIDGIFGLEYKIQELPVTISLDIKPFIEYSSYQNYPFNFWDAALSIRYVF